MSRLDHFLVLYRAAPEALALDADEVRDRLAAGPWRGVPFQMLESDPFLIAWKGSALHEVDAGGEYAPFLRIVGNPYNAGTARPAEIAAGKVVAAGELDGAFAAFAFDPATPQGTLLTDRFGLLPLYVHEADGILAYSSSLPLLLAARQPACRIDPLAVCEMLTLRMVLGNRTFFRDIRLVDPAAAVHLHIGPPDCSCYWSWPALCRVMASEDDLAHDLYFLIEQAVLRGVPPGPTRVALALDGGLVSRLLCAILTRHGVPVWACTTETGKEAAVAREVARALGLDLCELGWFAQPGTIRTGHEAIDCGYHVHQLASGELAHRAAEAGCDVLFDGLALEAVLGPHRYPHRDTPAELARELEAGDADLDEASLSLIVGDRAARIVQAVRESLEESAREAIDAAGPLAPARFLMTNRVRKYAFGSCLANLAHLPGRFPCITTRLFEHGMRLGSDPRREHALMRRIIREQFPELGKIPWAHTGLPLDQYALPPPPSRWRPWLERAVRGISRGRFSLSEHDRFDVDFRKRGALKGAFLEVLHAEAPELHDILPADFVGRVVKRHLSGRNLGGLLQGLYTVKHFLARFAVAEMAMQGGE
jgi:hypothetical protein